MFDALRTTCTTIDDLYLGAYLMYRGAKLEGVTKITAFKCTFTFTHKHLTDLIHEYEQYQEVRFSPKRLAQYRSDLKKYCATAMLSK